MGTLAYVTITAIPGVMVYISMLYILGSPLLAIVPAGICWTTLFFGLQGLRGE
jgi:hypothetical protein